MKNILFTILSLLIFSGAVNSQVRYFDEKYISTQSFVHHQLINPGAVGSKDKQVLVNYRNKWASFPDSPKTLLASYDGPISGRLGFGGLLLQDNNGALRTSKGQLSLSYTLDGNKNKLAFGLSGEYIQHKVDNDIDNPLFDPSDQLVIDRLNGISFFDVTFGVYGVYDNKLTYGVSLPSLVSSTVSGNSDTEFDPEETFSYIIHAGYLFDFEQEDIQLEPAVFIKKLMFVPGHVDLTLKAHFLDKRLTGGLNYSVGADERLGFLIGTQVSQLHFYYSYDVSRNQFQDYNNGSHELSFNISFGPNANKEIVVEDEKM